VQPGAAMAALQGDVPVVCAAIHGSQHWKLGNFAPVSIAWGEPMSFHGLPRGGKGYRQASAQIEAEIYRLWVWLRVVHETSGVTRDRKELVCEWTGKRFVLVDTGGVDIADPAPLTRAIEQQAREAVAEADLV